MDEQVNKGKNESPYIPNNRLLLLVPENWYRVFSIGIFGMFIDLTNSLGVNKRIRLISRISRGKGTAFPSSVRHGFTVGITKDPSSVLVHLWAGSPPNGMNVTNADNIIQALDGASHDTPMRPRASMSNKQVITILFGWKLGVLVCRSGERKKIHEGSHFVRVDYFE
jgi:hypothetical protein